MCYDSRPVANRQRTGEGSIEIMVSHLKHAYLGSTGIEVISCARFFLRQRSTNCACYR
jgi:hypothetical protein